MADSDRTTDRIIGSGPVIVGVDGSLMNIGVTQTSGIDAAASWTSAATEAGRFSLSLQGTYVRQFDTQLDGVTTVSLLGDADAELQVRLGVAAVNALVAGETAASGGLYTRDTGSLEHRREQRCRIANPASADFAFLRQP